MIEIDFDAYLIAGKFRGKIIIIFARDHASRCSYGVSSCVSSGDRRPLHGNTVRCSGVQCLSGDSAPPIHPYSQTKGSLVSHEPRSAIKLKLLCTYIVSQVYVWSSNDR